MFDALTYQEMLKEIKKNSEKYGITDDVVAILITRPDLASGKDILNSLEYYHFRTGHSINFYLPGYGAYWTEEEYPDGKVVTEIAGVKWSFSNQRFVEFIEDMEKYSKWRYSGESDLIFAEVKNGRLSYERAMEFHLDNMLRDKAIISVNQFFEKIVRIGQEGRSMNQIGNKLGIDKGKQVVFDALLEKMPMYSECEAVINAECIYKLMKLAGTEESIGVETLDDYAVQKIIGWFQQQEDIDLELRSDIEFIYLPMLDEYSEVRPRALNTRLSLEPEYFCSLIELFYKERNGEKREIELNKSLSDRLYEILFQFKVIPGIDWNGNFDAKRFDYWMKTVKTWSRDNDRYEVAMHTVGSGLSYAELDEDKLPQTAIIEELNRVENEELRRGYYLGIINQRGVHWIDPEGKPELELAEDYENKANIAESRGYSRYAGILRGVADEFKREAKSNILEAKNGDDE